MQKLSRFFLLSFCSLILIQASAQSPQTPRGTPGKLPLPSPKLKVLKPDLEFVSVNVVSVTEDESRHIFEITLSITYKNIGQVAVDRAFFLDLRNRYGLPSGGTGYSVIGSPALLHPLAAGETRTEEWVFAKDITALGRARQECIIRIDSDNRVAELNEDNNNSEFFNIIIPGRD